MTIIDDDVSEQIENFYVQLVANLPSSSLAVDLLPSNATVHIVDDDGTVSLKRNHKNATHLSVSFHLNIIGTIIDFESGTYIALEEEGSVLICIQVLNQIDSGHFHQANDSINLVILSTNGTASKLTLLIGSRPGHNSLCLMNAL